MQFAARVLRRYHLGTRFASTEVTSRKDNFKVLVSVPVSVRSSTIVCLYTTHHQHAYTGTAGISVSNQIFDRFKSVGKPLPDGDVAVVDAAEWHHYQPGWTLVGSGLKDKKTLRRPLASLVPKHITHVPENVKSFEPKTNSVTLVSGRTLGYDILVVATGLQINWGGIDGLPQALADPTSGVSSNYSYDNCDKVWHDIDALRQGKAIFTQPADVIKCPGAPQKIMNMAWDRYRLTDRGETVKVDFWTGTPTMFSVKKYSDALNKLCLSRGIHVEFSHDLIAIDSANHVATFKTSNGKEVKTEYSLLHAVPPQGPLEVIKNSLIADEEGWVNVDDATLQHKNPEYSNVFALGDCSSLTTKKTAAAITAQAPVLSENVFSLVDTDYGHLMLAEFKYGLEPKETFADVLGDQATQRRLFYYLKKDFLPYVYWEAMVKGGWYGTNGMKRPTYAQYEHVKEILE